ncbi:MAG: bactofilin family protein [Rectinemataceae bacterium]
MAEIRDSLVNTLVGIGSALEGDFDVDGMLRVDGDLRGSIRATGRVVVGSSGRIDASIRAQSVIVGGIVRGDLYVTDRARLLSGAVVLGNIFAPRLEAEDGATIHGAVEVTGRSTGAEEELKRFIERHGDPLRFLGPFRGDASAGTSKRRNRADDDGSGDSGAGGV